MSTSLGKQLTVFLLCVAVLLAPLNSFAQDAASGAAGTCACHLMPADCGTDEGDQPDHCPGDNDHEYCCEDHCPEAAEPQILWNLRLNIPRGQLVHPISNGLIPEVYLAIFVPPQNCSVM